MEPNGKLFVVGKVEEHDRPCSWRTEVVAAIPSTVQNEDAPEPWPLDEITITMHLDMNIGDSISVIREASKRWAAEIDGRQRLLSS